MNSFSEAIHFLYSLQKGGMKFGLHGIRQLLRYAGNPHQSFPCVHVAGTNGKGSTASMIAAVLTAAGYKTGLYTSPHLVAFSERIRINGKPITSRAILDLTRRFQPWIAKAKATFFEAATAIAFRHFADGRIDIAVIETGLGGRLDATNVVNPLVTVITNISLEHTEILGKTVRQIAVEKAGIIKRGIPCVTGVDSRDALETIRRTCESKSAPFIHSKEVHLRLRKLSLDGLVVDGTLKGMRYNALRISLGGAYQFKNVSAALLALREVSTRGFPISENSIRRGLSHVQKLSGLSSRLSVFSRRPFVLMDVAHNPAAMEELRRSLAILKIRQAILVFGVMKDKEHKRMIQEILPVISEIIAVTPSTDRARSSSELVDYLQKKGVRASNGGPVVEGVRRALERSDRRHPVLITGSHFVVGEALAFLTAKKYLTINQ